MLTPVARSFKKVRNHKWIPVLSLAALTLLLASCSGEFDAGGSKITINGTGAPGTQAASSGLTILMLMTVLSLAPAALMMMTSFTRTIIVLSFARSAIGVPQMPPNQLLLGLSLFLTIFVMAPAWQQVNNQALQPYLSGKISQQTAMTLGEKPLRDFMFKQTSEKDIALFVKMAKISLPRTQADVPTYVLIPAFATSELRTAFEMGFAIFIPFLIIDMVVSSTLMSMGMMMLPPAMISLPFKVLLFVLVDGWHLVLKSLLVSFG
ncbi:MAG: flagellar type III secretion system pore protein FliP [Chloroflexi bacterium]|nr:flagellar type III secretion system pore protein FliP [Chloroflexota bacterium]